MNIDTPTPRNADDDWLDAALRAQGGEHRAAYVADDGFTARVMEALPAPVAALPAWRRPAVLAIWGTAAAASAIGLPGFVIDVGREAFRLLATQPISLPQMGATLVALGIATYAAAAWALRSD